MIELFRYKKYRTHLPANQCDKIGLFLKGPGDKFAFTSVAQNFATFGPILIDVNYE